MGAGNTHKEKMQFGFNGDNLCCSGCDAAKKQAAELAQAIESKETYEGVKLCNDEISRNFPLSLVTMCVHMGEPIILFHNP